MSEYNNALDFNAIAGAYDMPACLDTEPKPTMDQSGNWNTTVYPQYGMMEGGTAAQLHARLDFSPFKGAKSNGRDAQADSICSVCLAAFQTAFALDNHAKEATHQAYKCKCGTDFNKHSALKRHIDTKDAPKTFACILCSDKFTRKDKVKDHCRHYHRATDEGLRNLFNAQEARPRGAAPRRLRARGPLAAASSASAPTLAPALPPTPAPAPATAGSPFWSLAASTGQQYADFPADPFVPAGSLATTSPFIPATSSDSAADFFTAALAPSEDVSGTLDDIFGDGAWATEFDDFNF